LLQGSLAEHLFSTVVDCFDDLVKRKSNLLIGSAALSFYLSTNDWGCYCGHRCWCCWARIALLPLLMIQSISPFFTQSTNDDTDIHNEYNRSHNPSVCKSSWKCCYVRIHVLPWRKWTQAIRKFLNFVSNECFRLVWTINYKTMLKISCKSQFFLFLYEFCSFILTIRCSVMNNC